MPAGIGGAHHREVGLRHAADHALRRQFAQPVDWIDDVQVALEPGAVEIDRDVADQDISRWHGRRQEAAFGTAEREGLIATLDQRGAGDDRHSALRQRRTDNEGLRCRSSGTERPERRRASAAVCPQAEP